MAPTERVQRLVERLRRSGPGRFAAKYAEDRADDYAAVIAFSALFSLFPLLGGVLALLGLVLQDPQLLDRLVQAIGELFPTQVSELLSFLEETRDISGPLGLASLVGLFWAGSNVFATMARAFNSFYGFSNRGLLQQRRMAFSMIFNFLILGLVSVAASGLATFLLGFSAERSPVPLPALGPLESLLGWGLSLGSAFLLFLTTYRVVPNGPVQVGGVWRGALLAAVLFLAINQLFPLYLRFFGGGFAAYKTLGLFLLLMTWFSFLARILVLGCELNAFLHPVASAERVKDANQTSSVRSPEPR